VVAIEPEAENFAELPDDENVAKIQAAVGGSCGFITIHLADDSTAHSVVAGEAHAATGRTQKIRMLDFTALAAEAGLSRIDFLKVDIEGCEWDFFDAMSDAQFAGIAQIAVEFHDFVPEYRDRVRTWPVYRRLMRLGFRCVEDPRFRAYNVLFVNRRFRSRTRSDAARIVLLDLILRLRWKIDRLKHRLKMA
jgi:FkbM family methyltransferase